MATRIWRGDAPEVAKVLRVVRPDYDAPVTFTIGNKTLSFAEFDAATIVAAWNASDYPELSEITASVSGEDVLLTADEPGVLFDVEVASPAVITITTLQQGRAAVDQQTTLTVPSDADGGTFTISCNFGSGTETTAAIAYNAAASAVQTALIALSTPVAGDIVVSGDAGGPYLITFTQNLSGESVSVSASGAALTGVAAVDIDVVQSPSNQIKEIQAVTVLAGFDLSNGGLTFTISDGDGGLTSITDIDDLQSGLDALYGAGVVTILFNNLAAALATSDPGSNLGAVVLQWANPATARSLIDFQIDLGTDSSICRTYRLQNAGGSNNHELWAVYFDYSAADTFTLTHDGNTTAAIPRDGLTTDIETALEALASLTAVTVTHFGDSLEGMIAFVELADDDINEPDLTATGASVAKLKDGGPLLNTVQRLEVTANSGTFTLSDGTNTTSALAYNIDAANLKSELEGDIAAIDNVAVTGSFPVWLIEFAGNQAATDVDALTANTASLVGGQDPSVSATTAAVAARNEKQQVTLSGNVGGGTFTLTHGTATTNAIDYNETAADLETLLDAALGANTTSVTGVPGGPYTIEFVGSEGGENQQLLEADDSSLTTAGTGAQVEQVTRSRGPNHADDPLNWTGDGPVDSGDVLIVERGAVDLLWGLRWVTMFTAADASDTLTLAEKADFYPNQAVRVWTDGGALPSNLSAGTNYYVRNFNREQKTLQLSATEGGAAIDLGSDGSGDLYIGVAVAELQVYQRFSGEIGLPVFSTGGYYEYRQRHLKIATTTATDTNLAIGKGEGPGSGLVRLEVAADHDCHARIYNTGGSVEDDQPACQLLMDDASSTVIAEGGTSGVAVLNAQSSTLLTVEARGEAQVHLGPNVTVTNIRSSGGGVVTADEANSGALILT